jgi:hypothetical protein
MEDVQATEKENAARQLGLDVFYLFTVYLTTLLIGEISG